MMTFRMSATLALVTLVDSFVSVTKTLPGTIPVKENVGGPEKTNRHDT